MTDVTTELKKPARKAARAARSATKTVKTTAETVAGEARTFGNRSAKTVKVGAAKIAGNAKTVKNAGSDAADIAQSRLHTALESLQATSEEMSRWAGARAGEAKDQASQLVQERPIGTIGAIFAVGALLGVVAGIALRN